MSSPPLDFPESEDIPMENAELASEDAGPANPLFLQGTPSAVGTPRRSRPPESSPLKGVVARRALAVNASDRTPGRRGTPLFVRSSSPMHFPTSSPRQTPGDLPDDGPTGAPGSGSDAEPLFFPSSPVKTPTNRRGDIHSSLSITPVRNPRREKRSGNVNLASDASGLDIPMSDPPPSSVLPNLSAVREEPTDEPDEIRAIWGTTVNLAETMKLFRDFLRNFKLKYRIAYDRKSHLPTRPLLSPEEGEEVIYETYLRRLRMTNQTNLNLDIANLDAWPAAPKLYSQVIKYPQEVIPAMDQVLKDLMLELAEIDQQEGMEVTDEDISDILNKVYKVRPFGVKAVNMRDLNPSDTDKIVCIRGLVIRATPVIPDMKTAFFRCLTCSHTVQVEIDRGKIEEPSRCPREVCASVGTMSLVHNRCEFADRQVIRLQETPDAVPDGQTPHTVSLSVYDELVDVTKPGDRVTVTGIFRSVPVRVNPRQRKLKSLFKTYIDVVHLRLQSGTLGLDLSTRAPGEKAPGAAGVGDGTDEDELMDKEGQQSRKAELEDRLRALSLRPDIYEVLAHSLAPSIWEMDDVKKGVLLQLFGGTNKNISRGGGGGGPRYRGDINVLLVGDPGTSKSQLLKYVHKIAPRGVYTSGKGSSAVGLTAYVTRDPDSKQLVLESGALVLSDGGVCCIDEFDKMSDATRSVLHEVMEQQTVSIAKAGIITTLNARTSILAAANPVGSKYDVDLPITRNIDLPPTLISRFDLLYLVLDQVDEGLDRKLAQHLVSLYLEDTPDISGYDIIPLKDLSAYIDFARSKINPTITEAAGDAMVQAYVEMRGMGASEQRITATTRQLESMIRLSEAHARMRFSPMVEISDVREANRLMHEALRTSAMDPRTGKIDIGLLNTGTGAGQRRLREDMRREILHILDSETASRGIRWGDVVGQLATQSSVKVDPAEFTEVIKALENESLVRVVGEREKRVIRKIEG